MIHNPQKILEDSLVAKQLKIYNSIACLSWNDGC